MAVTNFTPLLGLALPTTGDLSGTWGSTVNDAITDLLDDAVAGTTTLSADTDVTLSTTNGAANQARNAVILWTASNGASTRNITAPAQSKAYLVINAGTGSIVIRGAGPTTGVTVPSGTKTLVAWNGSDFVKVASNPAVLTTDVSGVLPIANGGTGAASFAAAGLATLTGAETLTNKTLTTPSINNSATVGGSFKLLEASNSGTNFVALKAPDTLAADVTYTLPTADGTNGQVLATNGSGALSWATGGGGSVAGSDTQIQFNNSGAFGGSSLLTFNKSTTTPVLNFGGVSGVTSAQFQVRAPSATDGPWVGLNTTNDGSSVFWTWDGNAVPLRFVGGGVERMRINAGLSGVILCLAGGDTSATGTGIAFPATQSASSNANTLDDYEQGTWTPTVVGTTTAGTATYSQQNGQYTKIGNMVTATAYVEWSAHTGTGNMTLGGLPFTTLSAGANLGGVAIAYNHNIVLTANNVITAYIGGNTTLITVDQYPVGGGGSTAVPMDASGGFIYTISYLAST
jgi:hypothetical protein